MLGKGLRQTVSLHLLGGKWRPDSGWQCRWAWDGASQKYTRQPVGVVVEAAPARLPGCSVRRAAGGWRRSAERGTKHQCEWLWFFMATETAGDKSPTNNSSQNELECFSSGQKCQEIASLWSFHGCGLLIHLSSEDTSQTPVLFTPGTEMTKIPFGLPHSAKIQ